MQILDGQLVHSASDLNAFTECLHLTALERAAAAGRVVRPQRDDPTAALLARKGDEHEAHHLERLRTVFGERLVAFTDRPLPTRAGYEAAQAQSIAAMERGAAIIYQATFFDGEFLGRADFLRRVERPTPHRRWSYEVIDTKLALSAKPYFLVQLCNYSEHVARISGAAPECAAIVLGSGIEQRFRLDDFNAYYRRLKRSYLEAIAAGWDAYPFECAHCDLCAWHDVCARRRDRDDHLSLVAGIRRDQIAKLEAASITTLGGLAGAADHDRPKKLGAETFATLRAQAAEQHRYRLARAAGGPAAHSYRFRSARDAVSGFARLPEPDAGDVFFDMEGDPMYRPDRALEYLFGVYLAAEDTYVPFWGTDPAGERRAFEAFVDFVVERRRQSPGLHVYHYAPYETTALKRLMGRYASREREIDGFLRAGTFVDLYPVVKQSVWISQPSYSIKKLEALYGFGRATQTRAGDDSIVMFESWLETHAPDVLEDIRAYNEDDCRSTFELREWLVRLRTERNAQLETPVAWRVAAVDERAPESPERSELATALLRDLPAPDSAAELRAAAEPVRARWLLGNLLEYHRREQKPEWWEHFERLSHPAELVDGDTKALAGLTYRSDVAPFVRGSARLPVYTFSYPDQEHEMRANGKPLDAATARGAGTIVSIDDRTRTLELRLAGSLEPAALAALVPAKPIDDARKRAAIERIARAYRDGSLETDHPATLALLTNRLPRFRDRSRGATVQPQRVTPRALAATIDALDRSYLTVQGPPGTGKSTLGASAIVDAIEAGKRVALAAHSHKALHGLLRKVEAAARSRGFPFAGCHKSTAEPSSVYRPIAPGWIADAPTADGYAGCALVSATTFAWADPAQIGAFDVVVLDEAGQVSLADALVTSLVARDIVLLGDPQQLPNVSKGSHPVGTDRSILEHLLDGAATVPVDRGIFLDRTYRLQPHINAFVSHAFYDGRLVADERTTANRITVGDRDEAGLAYVTVDHDGNTRRSPEEAEYIVSEIARLLTTGTVSLRDAPARPLTQSDILVVAPYNMQRVLITELLHKRGFPGVSVGTVDKFQGQEAPVVFYSLTSSGAQFAPRGVEFLLNPNRLNVAISRAQARCVLVFGSHLLDSPGASIDKMRLLNVLCEFIEYAGPAALRGEALQLPFALEPPHAAESDAFRRLPATAV